MGQERDERLSVRFRKHALFAALLAVAIACTSHAPIWSYQYRGGAESTSSSKVCLYGTGKGVDFGDVAPLPLLPVVSVVIVIICSGFMVSLTVPSAATGNGFADFMKS